MGVRIQFPLGKISNLQTLRISGFVNKEIIPLPRAKGIGKVEAQFGGIGALVQSKPRESSEIQERTEECSETYK